MTKAAYKFLKWMRRQDERVPIDKIKEYFGGVDDLSDTLVCYLELSGYIAGDAESADLKDGKHVYNHYFITYNGGKYVEERQYRNFKYTLTCALSAIGLVIALTTLLLELQVLQPLPREAQTETTLEHPCHHLTSREYADQQ